VTDLIAERGEPWRRRMYLPHYQVGEASRYAHISPQTVAAWHKVVTGKAPTLSPKEKRAALSYVQLIEVAVVAAFRRTGISLPRIRDAREYISKQLHVDYPFARYQFKTDGKHLLLSYQQVEGHKGRGKHLVADQGGQLEWDQIIGPLLKEFDYEREGEGIAIRWHLVGRAVPIVIDPRFSFGAPIVNGTPTWAILGRWNAGETESDIADDFGLTNEQVREALKFEGVRSGGKRTPSRLH
jgi:uncharacterized protein (DUF433 family)